MKKMLSILLSILIMMSAVCGNTIYAFAGSSCGCCDDCVNNFNCDCWCGCCDYCNDEDYDDEDYDDEDEDYDDEDYDDEDYDDEDYDDEDYDDEDYNDEDYDDEDYDDEDYDDEDYDDEDYDDGNGDDEDLEKGAGEDPVEETTKYTDEERSQDLSNLIATQNCGDKMFWYIREGSLFIFGSGRMNDYSTQNPAPWSNKTFSDVVIRSNIKTIGEHAFDSMKIKNVTIPSSVTEISDFAFFNCTSLTSVKFGKGMKILGNYAFYNCKKLKNITINNSLDDMGDYAFANCSNLLKVRFPQTLDCIPTGAFQSCAKLGSIILRDGLLEISKDAFNGCENLSKIVFSQTLTKIGESAFKNCSKLPKFIFSSDISTIANYAFQGCWGLNEIELPENTTTIGKGAFSYSGVKKATIKGSLYNFDVDMFIGCKNVVVEVYKNANVYKALLQKDNLEVVCAEHENKKLSVYKATMTKDGRTNGYYCLGCGEQTNVVTVNRIKDVSLSATSFAYNGKNIIPTVKVTDSAGKVIKASNYTVSMPNKTSAIGKYSVKITFKGNYSGTKTLSFTVVPAKVIWSSATSISKGFKASWKKPTASVTGYELQYSYYSDFRNAKKVTLGSSATSKSIKNLNSNKKCYIRIRSYKTSGSTKLYSAWSTTKTVTTKK